MTKFNGVTVIQRGNRPSPIIPAKLDFYNYIAGEQSDPFQVCSVQIFPNTAFDTASPYVNQTPGDANYGLVSSTTTNMVFHNYKRDDLGNRIGFDAATTDEAMASESDYTGDLRYSASSIFKEEAGHFSVILQPSGVYFPVSAGGVNGWSPRYNNSASGTGGYIDIWTVVHTEGSKAQIYVNTFNMDTANTFAVTEPLEVTTTNKLVQRYVQLGSKKRLQIQTDIVVDNEPIKQDLRNLMETGSLLTNPEISITKLNESPIFDARVQLTGTGTAGGFTSDGVAIDSQGTISYVWDTNSIAPFYNDEELGGTMGVYEVAVRYNVAGETIVSPRFKLIAR